MTERNVVDGVDREKIPDEYIGEPLTDDEMPHCASMMGHQLIPINDEEDGPQTRMGCLHCDESRLVVPGDLENYSDNHEYPPWCTDVGSDHD